MPPTNAAPRYVLRGLFGRNASQDATLVNGGPTRRSNRLNGRSAVEFGAGGALRFLGALDISGQAEFAGFVVGNRRGGTANQRAIQIGDIGTGGASVALDTASAGFRFNDGNRLFANGAFDGEHHVGTWRMTTAGTYGTAE